MNTPPMTRGQLLRVWRQTCTALTQSQLGDAVRVRETDTHGVGKSAVSNWEADTRSPDLYTLGSIDQAMQARGALRDMYLAMGMPAATPPRADWFKNFTGPSAAAWAWLRPAEEETQVRADVHAGPFSLRVDHDSGPTGVIVQAHASTTNPAVHVHFDTSGWADFGRGVIPRHLGFAYVEAAYAARLSASSDPGMRGALKFLKDHFAPESDLRKLARELLPSRAHEVEEILASLTPPEPDQPVRRLSDNFPVRDPESYRRYRIARGLSRRDVAHEASALPVASVVTEEHIEDLEEGRTPRIPDLPARLDFLYGADGHLIEFETAVVHHPRSKGWRLAFPAYWVGPVWVRVSSPASEPIPFTILWGWWRKDLRAAPAVPLSFRRSARDAPPPIVRGLPPTAAIRAGIGRAPGEVDVNGNWTLNGYGAARSAMAMYWDVFVSAAKGARGQGRAG